MGPPPPLPPSTISALNAIRAQGRCHRRTATVLAVLAATPDVGALGPVAWTVAVFGESDDITMSCIRSARADGYEWEAIAEAAGVTGEGPRLSLRYRRWVERH